MELRVHDSKGEFRVVYVAKFDAVYVLHAFQKKSRKTSRLDIELARARFGELLRAENDEAKPVCVRLGCHREAQ